MPTRNSSRRPGRTSIWITRLNTLDLLRSVCDNVYRTAHNLRRRQVVTEERFDPEALRTFGSAVLSALGVPGDDAALVADSLVQADLWGHSSHGLLRLPWYAARLRSGAMRAVTEPAVLTRSEEHTSELQSRQYLVCRLLLEKKKYN